MKVELWRYVRTSTSGYKTSDILTINPTTGNILDATGPLKAWEGSPLSLLEERAKHLLRSHFLSHYGFAPLPSTKLTINKPIDI